MPDLGSNVSLCSDAIAGLIGRRDASDSDEVVLAEDSVADESDDTLTARWWLAMGASDTAGLRAATSPDLGEGLRTPDLMSLGERDNLKTQAGSAAGVRSVAKPVEGVPRTSEA